MNVLQQRYSLESKLIPAIFYKDRAFCHDGSLRQKKISDKSFLIMMILSRKHFLKNPRFKASLQ